MTHRQNILVVDDERPIRGLIRLVLEDGHYEVRVAANGREAMREIEARVPNLILLDVTMPVRTGWEVMDELRRREIKVPIVIMTAGHWARIEAERNGAEAWLSKPFDIDQLLEVVERLAA